MENLIVEAKYKVFNRAPVSEIEFEEFVKLYLNHRPAFGEHYKRLRLAFRNFANISNEGYVMSREDLIDILTSQGKLIPTNLSKLLNRPTLETIMPLAFVILFCSLRI